MTTELETPITPDNAMRQPGEAPRRAPRGGRLAVRGEAR
jgi:hypothetical protein